MSRSAVIRRAGWSLLILIASGPATVADEARTAQPEIALELLNLKLRPLTKDELKVEAEAWLQLLKENVAATSAAEIAARAAPAEDATAAQQAREEAAALRVSRVALVDRVNVVLAELVKKGGDRGEFDPYVNAVSGVQVDVSDLQALWVRTQTWLTAPDGGLRVGRNLLLFVITMVVFGVLARLARKAVARALQRARKVSDLLREFMSRTVSRSIMILGFVLGLSMLELPISPLLAAIGAAGLVVALALQGTLSNLASGILILLYRPFDIGDAVEVGGVSGTVESMTLVSTSLATWDNKAVMVPNNEVWNNVITNITGKPTRRVDLTFAIAYEDDAEQAAGVLKEIVTNHPLVLAEPAPVIRLHELADSSVNLICRPWVKTSDYWAVYWDVTAEVKKRFDAAGISIPFPQRDVHLYRAAAVAAEA